MSICISAASIWVAASAIAAGDAVERCVQAREAVRSGALTVYQVWDLGDATIEREETAYFEGEQYRLDIHWDSSNSQVFELRGEAPDPLAILIWDGRQLLSRMADYGGRQRWSIREVDQTRFPFYSGRMLGLPGWPGPDTDVLAEMRLRGTVLDVSENEETVELTVRATTPRGTVSCTTLTVDRSQGWSVTSYVTEADVDGTHYTVKGYASPARFGDVWFPEWSRHEQYRNGEFDWAREYYVLEAQFNVPLFGDTFTWAGLGIKAGNLIFDHTTGRHLYWTGTESVPYSGQRRRDSRLAVPAVPTAPAARSAVPLGSAAALGGLALLGAAYALRALRRRT